jgi:phosphatidylinositol glycan class K
VKIHSHPGIGSEIFHRPLDKALITDFFGGVAQAEVFPLQEDAGSTSDHKSGSTSLPFASESGTPSLSVVPSATVTSLLTLTDEMHVWDIQRKEVRKWASVFIVGCIVSWVSLVR